MNIRVGIKTEGAPIFHREGETVILKNMLIGDNFHWQRSLEVRLPGEICYYESSEDTDGKCCNNITLINTLPIETYLQCVVGSEMNPQAPLEFLKAHSVISRSWALGKVLKLHREDKKDKIISENRIIDWDDTSSHKGFDVCSDDHCQRYQGLQQISQKAIQALEETKGEVLVDSNGETIDARFSKCCGGTTEIFSTCWQDVDYTYLKSFKDPWCDLSGLSSIQRKALLNSSLKDYDKLSEGYGYSWDKIVRKSLIEENLKDKFGINLGTIQEIKVLHRGPSGRIDLLRVQGTGGFVDIGKELMIRRLLSDSHLYSSAFELEDKGDEILLKGKGWGHGVGLCQIGATHQAMKGKNYKEILSFYYPETYLKQMDLIPSIRK